MIRITDKKNCCGCTACEQVCPKQCITMTPDEEGFLYPQADASLCVDCGFCEKACPVLSKKEMQEAELPAAFVVRTRNPKRLEAATSGGAVTEFAARYLAGGGVFYGAVYDREFRVVHRRIDSADDLAQTSGSKYVQSGMGSCFSQVKNDLKDGRRVLFCGTPCQCAGLKGFLGTEQDRLLLVDLVCHGVPSPRLWEDYLRYLRQKHGEPSYINFRSKALGYHVSVMEERFGSGGRNLGSARTNLMSKCFFKNAADRPVCYDCPFKTVRRVTDLTVFDSWHAADLVSGLKDDDRGYTCVLVQSEKGRRFFEKAAEKMECYPADTARAVELDGRMVTSSVARPESRDRFYPLLARKGIEGTVAELFPISAKDQAVEKSKLLLKKTGLLQTIKKIKR